MARPRRKPDYDPEQVVKEFMDAVAAEFGMTVLKARKLLITAGVYSTALSRQVMELHTRGIRIDQIMETTGLSRASVHSYLPYTKIPYKLAELSANAERIRLYRERKQKCVEFRDKLSTLSEDEQEAALWSMLLYLQGCIHGVLESDGTWGSRCRTEEAWDLWRELPVSCICEDRGDWNVSRRRVS